MSSISLKVNQQLVYTQQLLDDVCDNKTLNNNPKGRALLQSAYLHFELAVLYYCFEVAGDVFTKTEVELRLKVSNLVGVIDEHNFLQDLKSTEAQELTLLYSTPGSWLFVLLNQLSGMRARLGNRDEPLQAPIFAMDVESYNDKSHLLSVSHLTDDVEPVNSASLVEHMAQFKELVARHRSINEEY